MFEGQYRKRMIKQARKVPVDEVRRFIHDGDLDGPPQYFLLQSHGLEIVRGWHPKHGIMELSMQDDVSYWACIEYLKSIGLVVGSEEAALDYAVVNVFPKMRGT
jgi:hypothetical protein